MKIQAVKQNKIKLKTVKTKNKLTKKNTKLITAKLKLENMFQDMKSARSHCFLHGNTYFKAYEIAVWTLPYM